MWSEAIAHLGERTNEPRLQTFLAGIPCRCPLEPDEDCSSAGELLAALGIEFGFRRWSDYFQPDGTVDLFLGAVMVYGPGYDSESDTRPFTGALGRGLALSMSPADARAILGTPSKTVNRHGKLRRDHWFHDAGEWSAYKTDVVLQYAGGGKSIESLTVMIPHPSREP